MISFRTLRYSNYDHLRIAAEKVAEEIDTTADKARQDLLRNRFDNIIRIMGRPEFSALGQWEAAALWRDVREGQR